MKLPTIIFVAIGITVGAAVRSAHGDVDERHAGVTDGIRLEAIRNRIE